MSPRNLVDATGTRRRLEALAALGHTARTVGTLMGRPPATARSLVSSWKRRDRKWIDAGTAAEVAHVYALLADQPGTSTVVRIHALRAGCLPPAAWTGLDIDNPDHQPAEDPAA
ncbi:MAG TPA: hypothetical protein VKA83_22290 [Methylomirabilota bacterium]|nr:hypothetical protein [Methylomirabilota bacterium]